jgi:hypothetical protein
MIKDHVARKLSKVANFCGVDRAIGYTIIAKGSQVLAGPITLILIAYYLSPEEQGFYYTFASVVNLQIFFELGLSFVILQFASHEKAALIWINSQTLDGNPVAKKRLASLLRLAVKWYGITAFLMVAILIPAGISFLSSNKSAIDVPWQSPWVLMVVSAGGMLFLSPLISFLEGCGLVAEIAYMRVIQSLIGNFFLWSALALKTNLFAAAMPNFVGIFWIGTWLYRKYRYLFIDLLNYRTEPLTSIKRKDSEISWKNEIFPLQWRIALSWLSGYFIFFLFTPVLFKFYGPVVAGQMGMSLNITSAITGLAISWISTKSSPLGSLIAQKNYTELDKRFFPALWQSAGVAAIGGITLLIVVWLLHEVRHPIGQRFIELTPLAILCIATVANVYVYGLSVYLRAHKQEPFLLLSIVNGSLMCISTFILGRFYGVNGMMIGYLAINTLVGVGYGSFIFARKRREWHAL